MALLFLYMYVMLKLLTVGQNTVNVPNPQEWTCSQSSTYTSNYWNHGPPCNAANGDTNGTMSGSNCIHTDVDDREPYWEVDLGRTFPVSIIKVWGRTEYEQRLYPFTITVDNQICATVSTGGREHTVTCSEVLYGRRVRLTRGLKTIRDHTLQLCELQVLVNVANTQERKCSQSSTINSDNYHWHHGPPCNAANGDTNGTISVSNCIHTDIKSDDSEPHWEVDLGRTFSVSTIKVWGRTKQVHRLYPFNITVDDELCATAITGDREHTVTCSEVLHGQVVRLTRGYKTNDMSLDLCELQVFVTAQCRAGYHGHDCNTPCSGKCGGGQGSTLCQKFTGNCYACVAGYYGDQCASLCSSITNTNNRCTGCTQDGQCTACDGNFQPPGCSDCKVGFYKSGSRCLLCSAYCQTSPCDRQSGTCSGCAAGYHGARCDSQCSSITNTHNRCTGCTQDGQCTACSGNLQLPGCAGCAAGYHGARCDSQCSSITNTHNRCTGCTQDGQCTACSGNFQLPGCADCPVGYHGDRCYSRCSSITNTNNRCTGCTQDGRCTACSGSFKPSGCSECQDGYYRERSTSTNCTLCTWQCGGDTPCDKTTGDCHQCPDGRKGNRCDQDAADTGSLILAVGVAGTGVVLLVFVASVIGIIIILRRKTQGESADKAGDEPSGMSNEEAGVNITLLDFAPGANERPNPPEMPGDENPYDLADEEDNLCDLLPASSDDVTLNSRPTFPEEPEVLYVNQSSTHQEDADESPNPPEIPGDENPYEFADDEDNCCDLLPDSSDDGARNSRPTFPDESEVMYANQPYTHQEDAEAMAPETDNVYAPLQAPSDDGACYSQLLFPYKP